MVVDARGMRGRGLFRQQALAHQVAFAHQLREQRPGPGEVLGFPEGLELDTELAHSPDTQVAAGAIELVGHARQCPGIPLLQRVL